MPTRRIYYTRVTHIFEAVEVLISLIAHLTRVGLLLFHTKSSRIWNTRVGVNDGKGTIFVLVQLLVGVSVSLVVSGGSVSTVQKKSTFATIKFKRMELT